MPVRVAGLRTPVLVLQVFHLMMPV